MERKIGMFVLVFLVAVLLPAPIRAGGWATITLIDLPQAVEAGEPVEIEFVVRQHGQRPMADLAPTVRAASGEETISVDAVAGDKTGHYLATVTFPRPGMWTWEIDAFTMAVENAAADCNGAPIHLGRSVGKSAVDPGHRTRRLCRADPGRVWAQALCRQGLCCLPRPCSGPRPFFDVPGSRSLRLRSRRRICVGLVTQRRRSHGKASLANAHP